MVERVISGGRIYAKGRERRYSSVERYWRMEVISVVSLVRLMAARSGGIKKNSKKKKRAHNREWIVAEALQRLGGARIEVHGIAHKWCVAVAGEAIGGRVRQVIDYQLGHAGGR